MNDLLPGFISLGVIALVISGGYWFVRHVGDREDRRARAAKSAEYDARRNEIDDELIFRDLQAFFPALAPRWRELVEDGMGPSGAWETVIDETPGVVIGTAYGTPAILSDVERRKHCYIIGKTGSGKTSLMLHLIKADLEAGHGIGVIAPDAELFRDWLLPMIPEERAEDVVYFAPGNPKCPIAFNPLVVEEGHDQGRAAEELMTIFKRALGEEEFGARMTPIMGNAFASLVGRPGATLWDVKRILEDAEFRAEVVRTIEDDYVRDFWTKTYPQQPKGSHLPIVNRLDQFLRPAQLRRALCQPTSSFSIRRALDDGQILLFDLSGLAPESMLLLGQMLLSKFQLELMRREVLKQEDRRCFNLHADEFQTFAGVAEGTWRELMSRGRRMGLSFTLAHQHPSQLPAGLVDEILGNVGPFVVFSVSAKDAQIVRKELLELPALPGEAGPVSLESLVTLRTGQAVARLGAGAYSLPLQTRKPAPEMAGWRGEEMRRVSWERHMAEPFQEPSARSGARRDAATATSQDFLE